MKRLIFSALVLSGMTANAQVKDGMVGINTDEPRATMHIEPGVSESKGLIIPRITADQMKTMTNLAHFGADHHAIITYLKETLPPADRTGKLVDVAEPGYYYYDNTTGVQKWKTFGGGEQHFKVIPASTPGDYNYLTKLAGIGQNGNSLGTGKANMAIGANTFSLANNSDLTGNNNIAMGQDIYWNFCGTMSGYANIGIGGGLYKMIGTGSMQGGINIAIGLSLYKLQKANAQFTGSNNIGIGRGSYDLPNGDLRGSYNTGIGKELFTLQNGNLRGNYNIAIGIDSYKVANGDMTNTASSNIALGNYIYRLLNNSASVFSGKGNIGIGNNLYNLSSGNLTGQLNIGMGDSVFNLGGGDLSGYNNIGIGNNTMYGGTGGIGGTFNTALGAQSMRTAGGIAGNYNIALGSSAMDISGKITGRHNIAIGTSAMNDNIDISGNYNIGIGNKAMSKDLIKGNNNIQIGNMSVDTIVAGQLNKVVTIGNGIGNLTTANTYSNVILLGHDNPVSSPKVGVGTYQPKAKLDVAGAVRVANDTSACTSTNEGSIRYVSASKKFQGCDGTGWVNLN